jgi:hypothetical protein
MPLKNTEGIEVYLHAFLTSAPDGGKWSVSHPTYFLLGKEL